VALTAHDDDALAAREPARRVRCVGDEKCHRDCPKGARGPEPVSELTVASIQDGSAHPMMMNSHRQEARLVLM
jgi:hypothetical protein